MLIFKNETNIGLKQSNCCLKVNLDILGQNSNRNPY